MTFALGPILQGLSPIALKIMSMWVAKTQAHNKELIEKFQEFAKELDKSMNTSARLRASAQEQSKRLDEILAKMDKEA